MAVLLEGGAVVTVDDEATVHDPGWVRTEGPRIVGVGAGPAADRIEDSISRAYLTAIARAPADHELASSAADQMATLLMQRAGLKVAAVEAAGNSAANAPLLKEAEQFYDRAEELYQQRRDSIPSWQRFLGYAMVESLREVEGEDQKGDITSSWW